MDSYLMAKLSTDCRISALAKSIATQKMLVECLGASNCAGLSADESLAQSAQYELALAKLASMRQQLAALVGERDAFGVCL